MYAKVVELSEGIDAGLTALVSRQLDDGSWDGRFLPSAIATAQYVILKGRLNQLDRSCQRAAQWIVDQQNMTGGWGFETGMVDNPAVAQVCCHALQGIFGMTHPAVRRGYEYLRRTEPPRFEREFRTLLTYWGISHGETSPPTGPMALLRGLAQGVARRMLDVNHRLIRIIMNSEILMYSQIIKRSRPLRPWQARLERAALLALVGGQQTEGPFAGSWAQMVVPTCCIVGCFADIDPVRYAHQISNGLGWLEQWQAENGGLGQVAAMNVWESSLAAILLQESGRSQVGPALDRAIGFLTSAQLENGTSSWDSRQGATALVDYDDTAASALARWRAGCSDSLSSLTPVLVQQLRHGGSGAFGRAPIVPISPFLGNCLDVTCRVCRYLALALGPESPTVQDIVKWIRRQQCRDGSWMGVWYTRRTYGVSCAFEALRAAGIAPEAETIRAGVEWVKRSRNPDGGWGEDWEGARSGSTVEHTAYAVKSLALGGVGAESDVMRDGIAFLLSRQSTSDGTWDATQVGTFPFRFMGTYNTINYATIVALEALVLAERTLASRNDMSHA